MVTGGTGGFTGGCFVLVRVGNGWLACWLEKGRNSAPGQRGKSTEIKRREEGID